MLAISAMSNIESEKHQEPRNQVPEEGFVSEEGLAEISQLQFVKHIINHSIVSQIHIIIGEYII